MSLEQRNVGTRQMATKEQENALIILIDELDFVKECDMVFFAIPEMEEQILVRHGKLPHIPLNMDAVKPRPEDYHMNCLGNVNNYTCIPCRHKIWLCQDY